MPNRTEEFRQRTKDLALRIITLCRALPPTDEARTIARQLLRSGTSVAANYRAAHRARSRPEFVAKMGTVVEETDETVFWLEMLVESGIVADKRMRPLLAETQELLATFAAAQFSAKTNKVQHRT